MKQEEARKRHGIWKGLLSSLLTGAAVWMLLYVLTWGIPILGLPQVEEIVSARATFAGSTAEVKPGGHGACPKSARCPARLVWQGGRTDAPGGDDLYAGRR